MTRGDPVSSAELELICIDHVKSNTDGKIHPVKLNPFHVMSVIRELHELRKVLHHKNRRLPMFVHGSTTPCWCGHDSEVAP